MCSEPSVTTEIISGHTSNMWCTACVQGMEIKAINKVCLILCLNNPSSLKVNPVISTVVIIWSMRDQKPQTQPKPQKPACWNNHLIPFWIRGRQVLFSPICPTWRLTELKALFTGFHIGIWRMCSLAVGDWVKLMCQTRCIQFSVREKRAELLAVKSQPACFHTEEQASLIDLRESQETSRG